MEDGNHIPADVWLILFVKEVEECRKLFVPPKHCATHLYLLSTVERRAIQAYKQILKVAEYRVYTALPKLISTDMDKFLLYVTENEATQYEGQYGRRYVLDSKGRKKYVDTLETVGRSRKKDTDEIVITLPARRAIRWKKYRRNHTRIPDF